MDGAKKLQKEGVVTEDDLGRAEKEIQKLTDRSVESIDKHVANKEAELMTV